MCNICSTNSLCDLHINYNVDLPPEIKSSYFIMFIRANIAQFTTEIKSSYFIRFTTWNQILFLFMCVAFYLCVRTDLLYFRIYQFVYYDCYYFVHYECYYFYFFSNCEYFVTLTSSCKKVIFHNIAKKSKINSYANLGEC